MPLKSVESKPVFFFRWLKFLWVPSRKETRKARQDLMNGKQTYLTGSLVRAFDRGDLAIGTNLIMDGRRLILKGVYSKMEFPEAMVFWDYYKKRYVQFTGWGWNNDFQIIRK